MSPHATPIKTSIPYLKLSDGNRIPQLGLGTWLAPPEEIKPAVRDALEIGYRHIDCAQIYQNQEAVGDAITEFLETNTNNVSRSDLFVTSKIWSTFHSYPNAKEAIDIILDQLNLDYVDLMLIHWPMGYQEGGELCPLDENGQFIHSDVDYLDTWRAMEEAVAAGKIRSLGVSNFSSVQIERILKIARIKPVLQQVELHPYFQQRQLVKYCKEKDIVVVAYSSLFNINHEFKTPQQPNLLLDPVLLSVADEVGKTAAQVALRWSLHHGYGVIPKSVHRERLQENFNVWDFSLTKGQMQKIDNLDKGYRLLTLARDQHHPHYPFNVPF